MCSSDLFLLVHALIYRLPHAREVGLPIVDLGCGTGAAGLAWAAAGPGRRAVTGVDVNPWALQEAAAAYRCFDMQGRTVRASIPGLAWPRERSAFVAAFAVNELSDGDRALLLPRLLERAAAGEPFLVVEPLAKGVAPWWGRWQIGRAHV